MGRSKYKILDTTARLIGERGFGQVSVDEILKSSGVQKSNFYYHFKTKDELIVAAMNDMMQQVDSKLWQDILENKSLSPKQRLDKLVVTLISQFEAAQGKLGDPFGNLVLEVSEKNPVIQQKLNDYFIRFAAHIENVIMQGIDEDEFRQSLIPREAAEAILSQIQGAYILARAYQDPAALRRNIEFLINLISV